MSGDLQTIEEKTFFILKSFPGTRNSDRLLFEVYLKYFHNITTFHQQWLSNDSPCTETISRCRRAIQSTGRLGPWSTVEESRLKRIDDFKEYNRELQGKTQSKTRSIETDRKKHSSLLQRPVRVSRAET